MRTLAQKPKPSGHAVARTSPLASRTIFAATWQKNSSFLLPRNAGDQARQEKTESSWNYPASLAVGTPARGFDLSQIPVFSASWSTAPAQWKVGDRFPNDGRSSAPTVDKDPDTPKKKDAPPPEQKKETPPAGAKKRAGVDSFWVNWTEPEKMSPTDPKLRLDFQAKFKDDATHDPALAEFRQFAFHKIKVTAGPGASKYKPEDNSPLHDDHYSRADDKGGHDIHDIYFLGNDNPGPHELDKDDVIDYSFTAEQKIIDISDDSVVKTLSPYTAGIKGKHPRKAWGVPKMISFGKV